MHRIQQLALAAITASLVMSCDDPAQPEPNSQPELVTATTTYRRFYVSASATSGGAGTSASPWSLATALSQPSAVHPGDTLWLRGGTYRGTFHSRLTGTASTPIVLRQYPGERATIQGTLTVGGAYTWFWGFEVANTNKSSQNVTGIDARAPGVRLINLVVHDYSGNGMGVWSESPNAEVYGSIMYNNGFRGSTSSSYGHGIYAQNATGTKRLADNIVFQSFGYGFHEYTEQSYLRNFTLDGNVAFNNGLRNGNNILVGGSTPVEGLTVTRNMTYQTPGLGVAGTWLGRTSAQNRDLVARDNYLVGGLPAFRLFNWTQATVTGNTIVSWGVAGSMVDERGGTSGYQWSGNRYFGTSSVNEWSWKTIGYTFAAWHRSTSFGGTDAYTSGRPSATVTFIRPNKYEAGRANVIVYNWSNAGSVSADLSKVLSVGDHYEVRNAQRFYDTPIASGTYAGGGLRIPIQSVTPYTPIVGWPGRAAGTGTQFQVFVVLRAK
jgi:hypothetical protein